MLIGDTQSRAGAEPGTLGEGESVAGGVPTGFVALWEATIGVGGWGLGNCRCPVADNEGPERGTSCKGRGGVTSAVAGVRDGGVSGVSCGRLLVTGNSIFGRCNLPKPYSQSLSFRFARIEGMSCCGRVGYPFSIMCPGTNSPQPASGLVLTGVGASCIQTC